MNQVIEYLQKAERVEDQILIGLLRASRNIDTAVKIIQAARQADIGNDTNAVLDELLVVAQKLQQIVGARSPSPATT